VVRAACTILVDGGWVWLAPFAEYHTLPHGWLVWLVVVVMVVEQSAFTQCKPFEVHPLETELHTLTHTRLNDGRCSVITLDLLRLIIKFRSAAAAA
jgi:hypothetical protein